MLCTISNKFLSLTDKRALEPVKLLAGPWRWLRVHVAIGRFQARHVVNDRRRHLLDRRLYLLWRFSWRCGLLQEGGRQPETHKRNNCYGIKNKKFRFFSFEMEVLVRWWWIVVYDLCKYQSWFYGLYNLFGNGLDGLAMILY